jgi:hypothetical protein
MDWWSAHRLAEIALGAMLIEAVLLSWWHCKTGGGLPALALGRMLLPGALLLAALRLAPAGGNEPWLAVCLTAALAAHAADLVGRWGAVAPSPARRERR